MNVVLVSPYFPPNFYHFAEGLKRNGATVLAIGDESYDKLRPELKDSLTEYFHVTNMHNYDEMVRACGYFTWKYGKIDRLESHNEYWLETDARLRTDFDIFGAKTEGLKDIKNKSYMKQVYISAGIPVARGKVVLTDEEARAFCKEVGYPIVAKPDNGVGAAKTYRLNSDDDLEDFLASRPKTEYIMEEFIEGTIVSFDGLADRDGNIVYYSANEFSQGVMETVNNDLHISYFTLGENMPPGLEEAGRKTVKAFNVRERFFHLEFFKCKKDGRIVALEVNMRPPGGVTMDMFNYASDIDLYQEWANLVCFNEFSQQGYKYKYHSAHVGRKFSKKYVYSHEEIMAKYGDKIAHHEPISSVFRAALGEYVYIPRAEKLDDLKEIIKFIHKVH